MPITLNLLSTARNLAVRWHGDQKYGTEPYAAHLRAVESVLREFGHADNEELLAAAWLHDVVEDTPCRITDLVIADIPIYVIALVDAVTNRPGRNRAERHAATYPRIARIPDAVTLKLADRIANVRASVERRADLLKMYRGEWPGFRAALHVYPQRDVDMWVELETILKMTCSLCGSDGHSQELHDTEILDWLADDPASGSTNGRAYYAFKRRERKNYPGIRADVWWMMQNPVSRW